MSSEWEDALERKTGAKFAVEVVFDPDGQNITLDDEYDLQDISEITTEREIDVEYAGRPIIPDLRLTFNDPDRYFDNTNSASPFYGCCGQLDIDHSAAETSIKLKPWPGVSFAVGAKVIINDGTNEEEITVNAFTAAAGATQYHEVTYNDGLTNDFAANTAIYSKPVILRPVTVSLINNTETTALKLQTFKGRLVQLPETRFGVGTFTIADERKLALDRTLGGPDTSSAKKLMIIGTDGKITNSVHWSNSFNKPPLVWSISSGALPPGMALNYETGVLSGSPTTAGTYSFTVVLTNDDGESVRQDCQIVVYSLKNYDFDSAYGLTDFAEQLPDLGWQSGVTYSLATAEGYLTWAVATVQIGKMQWDIPGIVLSGHFLRDNAPGSMTTFCAIAKINAASIPTSNYMHFGIVTYLADRSSGLGFGYHKASDRIAVYDADSDNHYNSTAGMPSELIFRLRRLSGTIYCDYKAPSASTWTNLRSAVNGTAYGYIAIGIWTDNVTTDTVSGGVSVDYFRTYYGALAIETTQLANTRVGDSYSMTLKSTGGAGEYVYAVSAGSLPPGLTLNASTGIISGTPTSAGTYDFTIEVTDGAASTDTQELTIIVSADYSILPDYLSYAETARAYSRTIKAYVGGTLDRSLITVGTKCKLGRWTVKFTSETVFEIEGPGIYKTTGDISTEFAITGVLTIPAAAWGAGMAADDTVTFFTAVNFEDEHVVQVLYDLLTNSIHGNIAAANLDASTFFSAGGALDRAKTFDDLYHYCELVAARISVSLDREMSIAQALEAVGAHADIFGFHDFGIEHVHCFRPKKTTPQEFDETALKLPIPETVTVPMVNEINVQYAYDYQEQKYQGSYTYPETDAGNDSYLRHGEKISKTVYAPGIYSASQAQELSRRKYSLMKEGITQLNINLDLRALLLRIGEIYALSVTTPAIDCDIEVTKKALNLRAAEKNVAITGLNRKLFDPYFIVGTNKIGDGAKLW